MGRNLTETLKNIRDGKDPGYPGLTVDDIYEYGADTPREKLEGYCREADFVFHLAGVNRPEDESGYMKGNFGFTRELLDTLSRYGGGCPVMLASSAQAALSNPYGISKKAAEDLVFSYGKTHDTPVFIYRFPNIFGKWCRPNYNSVVATFCHNIARGLPVTVNDPETPLTLVYVDDVVRELIGALSGRPTREDARQLLTDDDKAHKEKHKRTADYGKSDEERKDAAYFQVPVTYREKLGYIAGLLYMFDEQTDSLLIHEIPDGSFEKKLYSTFLSYLPPEKMRFPLRTNTDARGSFTELLKTEKTGQVSVNVTKPRATKGGHWHHSKCEIFAVVSGQALIRERKVGTDEVMEFPVSGKRPEAVRILPGYTHEITNISDTEDLVTVMWASERFDPEKPDTYPEKV